MRPNIALAVCLCLVNVAWAQESFEAASIKPHPGMITVSSDPSITGNRVRAVASTLLDMICTAWHVRPDQVAGLPGWAASEHYDLEATAGHAITPEQMGAMLQTLLAQRFQLQVHHETREMPMFSLTPGKSGLKFRESAGDETPKGSIRTDGTGMHMMVAKGTMAQLASRLSNNGAGRPVTDNTGLTSLYSFQLDWVNDVGSTGELPSLTSALQDQLGLKLEAVKGPVEFLVVDHVERPSAN